MKSNWVYVIGWDAKTDSLRPTLERRWHAKRTNLKYWEVEDRAACQTECDHLNQANKK